MTEDAPWYGHVPDARVSEPIDLAALVQALATRIEALQQRLANAEYALEHQQCPVERTINDIRAVLAARWPLWRI